MKSSPGLICWEDSQDSADRDAPSCSLLQQKSTGKSQRRRSHTGKAWRRPASGFQKSSPSGITPEACNSSHGGLWRHAWNVCREVHQRFSAHGLCWENPQRSKSRRSSLPGGKQVLVISRIVCANDLGTGSPSRLLGKV